MQLYQNLTLTDYLLHLQPKYHCLPPDKWIFSLFGYESVWVLLHLTPCASETCVCCALRKVAIIRPNTSSWFRYIAWNCYFMLFKNSLIKLFYINGVTSFVFGNSWRDSEFFFHSMLMNFICWCIEIFATFKCLKDRVLDVNVSIFHVVIC